MVETNEKLPELCTQKDLAISQISHDVTDLTKIGTHWLGYPSKNDVLCITNYQLIRLHKNILMWCL